ncbi:uncharacterized protein LOC104882873 [Beta vulgaris subsp. vulgaris]|uniref:uncharacterized protein LOC104882873 n=1 Tax=Beta vulgaris subsp. vulgaris TaxID=3555 RepID=UPI00053F4256|nr:uncharacterized protein LOC104882873 [Beta vulgaris subsp. vulgaris]
MKERYNQNSINVLYNAQGRKLVKTIDIQDGVTDFYRQLLRSATNSLPMVDVTLVRIGAQVSQVAASDLIKVVSHREIDEALNAINDSKASVYKHFHVKDYRPIACCTMLFKIIAKILTRRMQSMITEVIDLAQASFMP